MNAFRLHDSPFGSSVKLVDKLTFKLEQGEPQGCAGAALVVAGISVPRVGDQALAAVTMELWNHRVLDWNHVTRHMEGSYGRNGTVIGIHPHP